MSTVEKLLTFYFRTVWEKAGLKWDGDNDSEIKELATALEGGTKPTQQTDDNLCRIAPQIIDDKMTGLQFEFKRSGEATILEVVGEGIALGNRDFSFNKKGEITGSGSFMFGIEKKPPTVVVEDVPKPAPTPATVEMYTVYGFVKSQYCVGDGGGSLQYKNHFVRSVIGTVVARVVESGTSQKRWCVDLSCDEGGACRFLYLDPMEYRALVDMMTKSGCWARIDA